MTGDGPSVNLTMATCLVCAVHHKNLKTAFKHPSTNEDVAFSGRLSYGKLVHNTLGKKVCSLMKTMK